MCVGGGYVWAGFELDVFRYGTDAAKGAVFVGALLFLGGLFAHMADFAKNSKMKAEERELASGRLETLLQAMIAMALVDGRLDDSEVDIIALGYQQVSGQRISPEEIAKKAEEMERTGFDLCHELSEKRKQIDKELRAMIVRGCVLVMKSDNEVESSELIHMNKMASILGLTEPQWNDMVSDFNSDSLKEGTVENNHAGLTLTKLVEDVSGDRLEILLQAMIAMALVDGRLDDSKVEFIAQRYKELSRRQRISPEEIAKKAAEMHRTGFDLCQEIREKLDLFDADLMYRIVRGCAFVLASDKEIQPSEIALMKEMTGVLGLTEQEWQDIVSDIMLVLPSK